jgi:cell division transport system permease protein
MPNGSREQALRADVRRSAASPRRISARDRFASYVLHHRQVALDSLLRMLRNPLGSLATWLMIGIALALPGGFYVMLDNLARLGSTWDGAPQISLFLKQGVDDEAGRALSERLGQRADVTQVRYLSKEDALSEFRELSGFGQVLDHLDNNPLPAVIVVRPKDEKGSAESIQHLFDEVKVLPEIDRAMLDLQWVQRMYAMLSIGRRVAMALGLMLGLGVLLVIVNTIRLAIESRRDEILVVKLVGGTNAFVRRPFLYTGIWFGLGGGLIAWLLLSLGLWWLGNPVAQLADLYDTQFSLNGLNIEQALLLLAFATGLGWLGAWMAVGRHLSVIEPR